jgi:hypothetical protein
MQIKEQTVSSLRKNSDDMNLSSARALSCQAKGMSTRLSRGRAPEFYVRALVIVIIINDANLKI